VYVKSRRAFSESERERLERRVEAARREIKGVRLLMWITAGLVGLSTLIGLMILTDWGHAGFVGAGLFALVFGILLLFLFGFRTALSGCRANLGRLQEALAEGNGNAEWFEAEGAVYLQAGWSGRGLMDLGGGKWLAIPDWCNLILYHLDTGWAGWRGWRLPALVRSTTTSRHRILLCYDMVGRSTVEFQSSLNIGDVTRDRHERRRLNKLLDEFAIFPGTLATLDDDLRLLVRHATPPETAADEGNADATGMLQARIEDRFGIVLGPGHLRSEFRAMRQNGREPTGGDLLVLMRRALPPDAADRITPLRAEFYRIRRALVTLFGNPRELVRPSTSLSELVPFRGRPEYWRRLGRELRRELPVLPSAGIPTVLGIAAVVGLLMAYLILIPGTQAVDAWAKDGGVDRSWWYCLLGAFTVWPLFIGFMILPMALASYLFRYHFTARFPPELSTVGALARNLADTDVEGTRFVPWDERAVWQALRSLLAEAAGRLAWRVTRETRLAVDLGIGMPFAKPTGQV
jgi:hypothetical protein